MTEVQNGRGIIGCGASADPIDASGELGLVFINTQPADEDFKPSSEVRGLQPVDLGVTTGYITADISGRTLRFDTEPAIAANFVTVVGNVKGEDVTPAAAKLGSAFARVMAYQATRSTTPTSSAATTQRTTATAPAMTTPLTTPSTPVAGSESQSVAYRQGYQAAREDLDSFVPATSKDAGRVIATRCGLDDRSIVGGARSQDWIDGCYTGTLEGVDDRAAVSEDGPSDRSWYRVGYQTGREHHSDISARQDGDLQTSCQYEAHLSEVPADARAQFTAGCVDGTTQAEALAAPTKDRRHAPKPFDTESSAGPAPTDEGDLGLGTPITTVACDGEFVVIVGSAVSPDSYASDVQRFLSGSPGSKYLRTDRACSSLVQEVNGNPIYAVFQGPFKSRSEACTVAAQMSESTVKQLIDSGEPRANEQCD
ncbi:MAG: hypothetical protein WKF57_06615 [Nakamurella sp.]